MGQLATAAPIVERIARELTTSRGTALVRAAARAASNLILCGETKSGETILASVEAAARSDGLHGHDVHAWLARAHAMHALHKGELETFVDGMLSAVEHLEAGGDVRQTCIRRVEVAYGQIELGRHEEAERLLRAALDDAERLGLQKARATALHNLGWALYREGRFEEASRAELEAIDAFVAQGDLRFERASRIYLARIALASGDLDRAESEARRACDQTNVSPTLLAIGPATLGAVLLARGRHDEALGATRDAVALLDAHGADESEVFIRITHALAIDASGDREAARRAIVKANDRLRERASATGRARETFLTRIEEHALTSRLASERAGTDVEPSE
jgi:tetratricopeptide (TPR) repeat protein